MALSRFRVGLCIIFIANSTSSSSPSPTFSEEPGLAPREEDLLWRPREPDLVRILTPELGLRYLTSSLNLEVAGVYGVAAVGYYTTTGYSYYY